MYINMNIIRIKGISVNVLCAIGGSWYVDQGVKGIKGIKAILDHCQTDYGCLDNSNYYKYTEPLPEPDEGRIMNQY